MNISFEVNKLALGYIMQLRGVRDFGISHAQWQRLLSGSDSKKEWPLRAKFQEGLDEEHAAAAKLRELVEKEWRMNEKRVVSWLRQLSKVDFKEPEVRVCVVHLGAGQTPFKEVPLIVVGRIRKGWGYTETIAHELAHVLFNQNFSFKAEVEHPYIQLIEEEVAVRLGVRSKYFGYDVPAFAGWVSDAKRKESVWRHYLKCIDDYEDISQFIGENEKICTQ